MVLRISERNSSPDRGIYESSTRRSLPRDCHRVSAERRSFKTGKTNRETVKAVRGAVSPDLLGTWRGAGFSVLNWHRLSRRACDHVWFSLPVTWDACRCQRVWREADIEPPLHSRRGLYGHYVYEKALCGGPKTSSQGLSALAFPNSSVMAGLFYPACAFHIRLVLVLLLLFVSLV